MTEDIYSFIDRMIEEEEAEEQQEVQGYQDLDIKTVDEAERMLWYYKKLQTEIAEAKQHAIDYVREAQAAADKYLANVCTSKERNLEYVEQRLRDFTVKEMQRTKKKTVKLVNGTMSLSKRQPSYERDEDVILAFCANSDENSPLRQFLKPQPPKLDWATLKKESTIAVDSDGEKRLTYRGVTIPSVVIKDQEDAFKVK